MTPRKNTVLVPVQHITQSILILRSQRVLLDSELAALYGVTTKALNRSQSVTGSQKHRDPRCPPFAFTEHGAIMAATILNSPRAVEMSLYVVRAFVKLRELLASNQELARRLDELEARITRQFATHDQAITGILKTIRELMNPPEPKKRPIGFVELEEKKGRSGS